MQVERVIAMQYAHFFSLFYMQNIGAFNESVRPFTSNITNNLIKNVMWWIYQRIFKCFPISWRSGQTLANNNVVKYCKQNENSISKYDESSLIFKNTHKM